VPSAITVVASTPSQWVAASGTKISNRSATMNGMAKSASGRRGERVPPLPSSSLSPVRLSPAMLRFQPVEWYVWSKRREYFSTHPRATTQGRAATTKPTATAAMNAQL
jgi:hypothetical protein